MLVAFAFMAVLAVLGLAVDATVLYTRMAQLGVAIDQAAVAGATRLYENDDLDEAHELALQWLEANGWEVAAAVNITRERTFTPAGQYYPTGLPQYTITATYAIPTNFMRLFGFNEVEINQSATALVLARPELFTPTAFEWGVARKAHQFIFGPNNCSDQGDPVSARYMAPGVPNPEFMTTRGVYQYRIRVNSDEYFNAHGTYELWVELFDPDSYNHIDSTINMYHTEASQDIDGKPEFTTIGSLPSNALCHGSNIGRPCILETGPSLGQGEIQAAGELRGRPYHNPFWFVRVDEGWPTPAEGECPAGPNNALVNPTLTRFELYYLDMTIGPLERQLLSQYDGPRTVAEGALDTDLQWVVPTEGHAQVGRQTNSGSFIVDLNDIPINDEDGLRHIYLDVFTLDGASKNVFDVWARPPNGVTHNQSGYTWNLPDNINDRNLHILDTAYGLAGLDPRPPNPFDVPGVDVYALGRMPLNHYVRPDLGNGRVEFAMVPIDEKLQVAAAYASIFDRDVNTNNIVEYAIFLAQNNPPRHNQVEGAILCDGSANCNNQWVTPNMHIPNEQTSFGILLAEYQPGVDSHTWQILLTLGAPVLTR